jgi:hypothetical protein
MRSRAGLFRGLVTFNATPEFKLHLYHKPKTSPSLSISASITSMFASTIILAALATFTAAQQTTFAQTTGVRSLWVRGTSDAA